VASFLPTPTSPTISSQQHEVCQTAQPTTKGGGEKGRAIGRLGLVHIILLQEWLWRMLVKESKTERTEKDKREKAAADKLNREASYNPLVASDRSKWLKGELLLCY